MKPNPTIGNALVANRFCNSAQLGLSIDLAGRAFFAMIVDPLSSHDTVAAAARAPELLAEVEEIEQLGVRGGFDIAPPRGRRRRRVCIAADAAFVPLDIDFDIRSVNCNSCSDH